MSKLKKIRISDKERLDRMCTQLEEMVTIMAEEYEKDWTMTSRRYISAGKKFNKLEEAISKLDAKLKGRKDI